MPIWRVLYPGTTLSPSDRAEIAAQVTDFYVSINMPDFYVSVAFEQFQPDSFFYAGKPTTKNVMVMIDHFARTIEVDVAYRRLRMNDAVDRIMKPYVIDRGLHLEFFVSEGHPYMWRMDGIDPPEALGEDQKELAEKNKALLYKAFNSNVST